MICLENGAPGQTIRATSPDHRQIYTAQVGEDGSAEGKAVMTCIAERAAGFGADCSRCSRLRWPAGRAGGAKKTKNQLRPAAAGLHRPPAAAGRSGVSGQTVGSLWTPGNTLGDLSTDYKARKLNDTIVILVAVQTTAAQKRMTPAISAPVRPAPAITGLAGDVKTTGLNPLLQCQLRTPRSRAPEQPIRTHLSDQPDRRR